MYGENDGLDGIRNTLYGLRAQITDLKGQMSIGWIVIVGMLAYIIFR